MESIHKYFLTLLLLLGVIFSQDTEPPNFYCEDNGSDCSNPLSFSNEINFDSGAGEFYLSTTLKIVSAFSTIFDFSSMIGKTLLAADKPWFIAKFSVARDLTG